MRTIVDITGNRYNMLKVISFDHIDNKRRSYWKCRCDCGKEVVMRKDNFIYPYSANKSCGCSHKEVNTLRINLNRDICTGRILATAK